MKRTPLKRVGSKVRRVRATCATLRCKRSPRFAGYCKTHATKMADNLFSLAVRERDRRCLLAADFPGDCGGRLQCCHLISRSYRATRWVMANAITGCAGHHRAMDTHPLEKDRFIIDTLGAEHYGALRVLALTHVSPDVGEVIELLRLGAAA